MEGKNYCNDFFKKRAVLGTGGNFVRFEEEGDFGFGVRGAGGTVDGVAVDAGREIGADRAWGCF